MRNQPLLERQINLIRHLTSEEFIFGSDSWNPDTDGDGWTDGVEVANGKNPVGPGALFGFGL